MIRITQWTRKAQQEREIKTHENGDRDLFVISITHHDGLWRASWEQCTDEYRTGYKSRLSCPCADYNGQTSLKIGRFSAKALEKYDAALAANFDKYYQLWQAGEYQALCNEIHADTATI